MDNTEMIKNAIASNDRTTLVELNDYAIHTIRDRCHARGYNAAEFYAGECARITRDRMSLGTYLKCRRVGSEFRVPRSLRRLVWAAFKTRRLLRAL